MRQPLTLLAMLIGGASQAQPDTFRMPPHYYEPPAAVAVRIPVGPKAVLEEQSRQARHQKTATTAFRMTGSSRYDHEAGVFLDSNRLVYSGTRGSTFADEAAVLNSGQGWAHSRPDFYTGIKARGTGRSVHVANKYDASNYLLETIDRSGGWAGRYRFTNNAAGQMLRMTMEDSTASGWQEAQHSYYRYNAAGLRILDSVWSVAAQAPAYSTSYSYTAAGKLDTTQSRLWDGSTMRPNYRLVNGYDAAGNLRSTTNYFWDQGGAIVPGERFLYTYYAANQLVKESFMDVYLNGQWLRRQRDTMGYTGTKTLYTYYRQEGWDNTNGAWLPFRDWTFTLDGLGRWKTQFYRDRDASGQLVPGNRMDISYDANGMLTGAISYRYNIAQSRDETDPYEEDRYYYEAHEATGVKQRQHAETLRAYPNPACLQLNLESTAAAIESVTILSTTGQHIPVQVVCAKTQQIDVSALPQGVYYLQLQLSDQSAQTLRFVRL